MSEFCKIQRSQYISKLLKRPKDSVIRYPPRDVNIGLYNLPFAAKTNARLRYKKLHPKGPQNHLQTPQPTSKSPKPHNIHKTSFYHHRRHSMPAKDGPIKPSKSIRSSSKTTHRGKIMRTKTLLTSKSSNSHHKTSFRPPCLKQIKIVHRNRQARAGRQVRVQTARARSKPRLLDDRGLLVINRLMSIKK